jgi:hypothetical protein
MNQLNCQLLKTSRWIDRAKSQAKRLDPVRGWETDSVLYCRLCMLQDDIGRLIARIDKLEERKYRYK